jgi:group I intron endonuclease
MNTGIYGLSLVTDPTIRYVGLTSVSFAKRFAAHKRNASSGKQLPVYGWMRKHGISNVRLTVLEEISDFSLLNKSEIFWIQALNTEVAFGGLNCSPGGGQFRTDIPHPNLGKSTPDAVRAKISASLIGKKRPSHSAETKSKMSISASGSRNPNFGKPYSSESKEKRADTNVNNLNVTERRHGKLSWGVVTIIREQHQAGHTVETLAGAYNVSTSTIKRVINNVTWKEEDRP